MVNFLVAKGVIAERDGIWRLTVDLDRIETGVPENVRQMIEKQFDRLHPDVQRTLEAASVAGVDFAIAALATVTDTDALKLEELCDELAQRFHFLKLGSEYIMPDGTLTTRYAFAHALYQDVRFNALGRPTREASPVNRRMDGSGICGSCWRRGG